MLGVPLKGLDLRRQQLSVVLIERQHVSIIPTADSVIQAKDHLVVFGRLEGVQQVFAPSEGAAAVGELDAQPD